MDWSFCHEVSRTTIYRKIMVKNFINLDMEEIRNMRIIVWSK